MSSGRAGRFATCVAIIAVALSGCRKSESNTPQQGKAPQPVTVTVQPAVLQDVLRTVPVIGDLRGDEQTTISAKVPGRIAQIFKDVGDRVSLNEPLAQVDKTDYELARNQAAMAVSETLSKLDLTELPDKDFDPTKVPTVHRAALQVENAKAKLERGRQVSGEKAGAISEQELADLQTAFEVAKSSYDVELLAARSTLALARAKQSELLIATQRLEDSTVRAPAAPLATSVATAAVAPSTVPLDVTRWRHGSCRSASTCRRPRPCSASLRMIRSNTTQRFLSVTWPTSRSGRTCWSRLPRIRSRSPEDFRASARRLTR
jgi:multidrug efflux pump subunit AcrA (membrane-fusion protein)